MNFNFRCWPESDYHPSITVLKLRHYLFCQAPANCNRVWSQSKTSPRFILQGQFTVSGLYLVLSNQRQSAVFKIKINTCVFWKDLSNQSTEQGMVLIQPNCPLSQQIVSMLCDRTMFRYFGCNHDCSLTPLTARGPNAAPLLATWQERVGWLTNCEVIYDYDLIQVQMIHSRILIWSMVNFIPIKYIQWISVDTIRTLVIWLFHKQIINTHK